MSGYTDIHVHILPAIDEDGPPDLKSSLAMAGELVGLGFHRVIATPHCFEGSPAATAIIESQQRLSDELSRRGIELEVLPGA